MKKAILILLVIVFLVYCAVPQYSSKNYIITKKKNDSTYIGKIRDGVWIESREIIQSYEEWKVGDTIFFSNKKTNE